MKLKGRHTTYYDVEVSPMDCAKSDSGAERVKDILYSIKYGGVV